MHDAPDTLGACWQAWKAVGHDLSEADWQLPTRLGSWSVAALYAHHSAWPGGLARMLEGAAPGDPDLDRAAEVVRAFHRAGGIASEMAHQIEAGALRDASATPTAQLVARFDAGGEALAAARVRLDHVLDYYGAGRLRVSEVLALGVLESTVHLLDLLAALDRPPELPAGAASITKQILSDAAPDVELIEAAAGRRPDAPFPVLS